MITTSILLYGCLTIGTSLGESLEPVDGGNLFGAVSVLGALPGVHRHLVQEANLEMTGCAYPGTIFGSLLDYLPIGTCRIGAPSEVGQRGQVFPGGQGAPSVQVFLGEELLEVGMVQYAGTIGVDATYLDQPLGIEL